MRIPIDLLPPIKSLPGSFRTRDCFVCAWCVFSDYSVEQRAEMTATSRDGTCTDRVIIALQNAYPEHIWRWDDYIKGGIPNDVRPGQAALIIYEISPETKEYKECNHFAILMNQGGEYVLYDPQSLTIELFDCLTFYKILNAYHSGDLFEGKLPPRRIKFKLLSSRHNPEAEQHQIYYSTIHYLRNARKLFKEGFVENDIEELREIGHFINKVNDMNLDVREQQSARYALNDVYARHYKSLIGWRPGELVALKKRPFLKNNKIKALAKEIYMNHI